MPARLGLADAGSEEARAPERGKQQASDGGRVFLTTAIDSDAPVILGRIRGDRCGPGAQCARADRMDGCWGCWIAAGA